MYIKTLDNLVDGYITDYQFTDNSELSVKSDRKEGLCS